MAHPTEFAPEEVFSLQNEARLDTDLPACRYTSLESLLTAAEEAAAARSRAANAPPTLLPFARRKTTPIV